MSKVSWKSIAGALGRVAPAAGAVVGGPAGAIVGNAVGGLVAQRLGVPATPAAVEAAIAADPEAAAKLAQLDQEIALAAIQDVQHARTVHAGHWMTWALPMILLPATFAAFVLLFVVEVPLRNEAIAYTAFGALLAWTGDAIRYWIGSSRGSADKSATLDARR